MTTLPKGLIPQQPTCDDIRRMKAEAHASRRERIATACLAGILADNCSDLPSPDLAEIAVRAADALIARLDHSPRQSGPQPD